MNIYGNVGELVGHTPLMRMSNYEKLHNINAQLLAKLEFFNPCGSIKDRIALNMLESAEKRGDIKPGATVIEPTSGNTGIGLAAIAAARGYKAIIVMPDTMSVERRQLIAAYSAQIVLTEGSKGMSGAVEKANELHAITENSFIAAQFDNPDNPLSHELTTGPELWEDTDGKLDVLVAGVGTGGTITGIGKYLKSKNPSIEIVAVEPFDSPLLSKGRAGSHKLQGIGANFVPKVLDTGVIDRILTVTSQKAFDACRDIARTEGILCGISSGAAVSAACELAENEQYRNKRIAIVLPDSGERYMSMGIFN